MLPIASAKSSNCYFLWQNASAGEAGEEKSIIRIFLAVRRGCEKWQLRALSLFIGHRKHSHQEHYTRASVEECLKTHVSSNGLNAELLSAKSFLGTTLPYMPSSLRPRASSFTKDDSASAELSSSECASSQFGKSSIL